MDARRHEYELEVSLQMKMLGGIKVRKKKRREKKEKKGRSEELNLSCEIKSKK